MHVKQFIYNGYRIALNGSGVFNLINGDFTQNVVTFCNSLSKEPGNVNNNFLALRKDKIECIEDKVSKPKKLFSINFAKSKTKLFLSLHCNGNNRYMYASKIQIFNFKCLDNIAPHLE